MEAIRAEEEGKGWAGAGKREKRKQGNDSGEKAYRILLGAHETTCIGRIFPEASGGIRVHYSLFYHSLVRIIHLTWQQISLSSRHRFFGFISLDGIGFSMIFIAVILSVFLLVFDTRYYAAA